MSKDFDYRLGWGDLDPDLESENTFGHLAVLERYLGKPLGEAFHEMGINRALEVGVGHDFRYMKQLARLNSGGQPVFHKEDLLAIDKEQYREILLKRGLGTFGDKFLHVKASVEDVRKSVEAKIIPPFGLVMSRGVGSTGAIEYTPDKNIQDHINDSLGIVNAMKGCLDTMNPNSLILMQSYFSDEILLISREHLKNIGLEIVHFELADPNYFLNIFRRKGIFANEPESSGFKLVICQKV